MFVRLCIYMYMFMYLNTHVPLYWLTEEFLPYLDQWEESVMARKDVTNVAKKMMMLSTETLQGLKLTGINNTL